MAVSNEYPGDFCAFCGHTFERAALWPRICPSCEAQTEIKHIPLITVLVPAGGGFRTVATMPRQNDSGCYLPSSFLDFGETWRQAAARRLEVPMSELLLRSIDARTRTDGVSNILAVVDRGAELVCVGEVQTSPAALTCEHQREIVTGWLAGR